MNTSKLDVSRRSFLRYAGVGLGSVVIADPLSMLMRNTAMAEEDATGAQSTQDAASLAADASSASDAPAEITGTFKFGGSGKANFIFNQQFFNGSSFNYSNQVSTFALCVALSAFGANDNISEYSKSPTNAQDFFGQLKCNNIVCNEDYTKETQNHTIGLIAGHRTIQADNKTYELVLMGIRGANYFYEWGGNTTVGNTGDHEGFTKAANKALDFLKSYVNNNVPIDNPLKIVVSGFSRASATANMTGGLLVRGAHSAKLPTTDAAHTEEKDTGYLLGGKDHADLVQGGTAFPFPKHSVYQKDVYFYGFEVPSGAHDSASTDAEILASGKQRNQNPFGNIFSIVNPCDVVPMVAPTQWKFGRFGVDHILPRPSDSAYASAREAMLKCADKIDSGYRAKYPVDSFKGMDAFFNTMIDKLVHDLTGSQATYVRDYQAAFTDLIDYMQTGKIYRIEQVSSKTKFKAWLWTNVIADVLGDFLLPGKLIIDLIVLAYRILANSLISHMLELAVDSLKKFGLEWGAEEEKLYKELLAICPMIQKFAKGNISLFVQMIRVFVKEPNTMEIHSATLCLAWMQSYDSGYNTAAKAAALSGEGAGDGAVGLLAEGGAGTVGNAAAGDATSATFAANDAAGVSLAANDAALASEYSFDTSIYKMVLFDGKIDVWALGESSKVKIFEAGKPVDTSDFPYWHGLNEDFQMAVLLPIEPNFIFKVECESDDLFSITSLRYEHDSELPARILSYNAIGDSLDTIYITVKQDAILASATEETTGLYDYAVDIDNTAGNKETHCNVIAQSANEAMGVVIGGGYNVYGTSSHLSAVPHEGFEFDYWDIDGERETEPAQIEETTLDDGTTFTAAMYPFYVAHDYDESVTVTAHFKEKTAATTPDNTSSSSTNTDADNAAHTTPNMGDAGVPAAAAAATATTAACIAAVKVIS